METQVCIRFSTVHVDLQWELLVEMESDDLKVFETCFPHYEDIVAPIYVQKSYLGNLSRHFLSLRNLLITSGHTLMVASAENPTINGHMYEVFQSLMVQPMFKYEPHMDIFTMTHREMSSYYDSTVFVLGDSEGWVTKLKRRREMETLHQILGYMNKNETMLKAAQRMCRANPKHRLLHLLVTFFAEFDRYPEPGYGSRSRFTTTLKTTNERVLSQWYMKIVGKEDQCDFMRRFDFYQEMEELMRQVLEKIGFEESYLQFCEREPRLCREHGKVLLYLFRMSSNGESIIPEFPQMRIPRLKNLYNSLREEKWKADALESLVIEINRRVSSRMFNAPPSSTSLAMPNSSALAPSSTSLAMPNSSALPMLDEQQISSMIQELQMPNIYERFIFHFPDIYASSIESFQDVTGDGHCGFRCVAAAWSSDENKWSDVRINLLVELNTHENRYVGLYGRPLFEETKIALGCFGLSAPERHWFDFETMGYLVANSYNMMVIMLSNQGSMTFLPLWRAPPESSTGTILSTCIGRINENHFIRVILGANPLIPALEYRWMNEHLPIANGWMTIFNNFRSA